MKIFVRDEAEKVLKGLPEGAQKWEFVVSGEASQTPVNEWKVAFYVAWTKTGGSCILRCVDLPEEDEEPVEELVAVAVSATGVEDNEVVKALLDAYWSADGKYIECAYDYGRFDLGDLV
jgi:hypothetical protein